MSTTPYNATGRRKEAIAHAWLTPAEEGKSGKITINRRSFEEYLPTDALQNVVLQPFYATNTIKKYDVRIVSKGGGIHGQTGAMSLAIARSLVMVDEEYRSALREQGLQQALIAAQWGFQQAKDPLTHIPLRSHSCTGGFSCPTSDCTKASNGIRIRA